MATRVILLILDAMGVGAMPDVALVRPQDAAANTLASVARHAGPWHIENLLELGLGRILPIPEFAAARPVRLAGFGRCRLAHTGADSYLGHQEIMGTIPKPPVTTLMSQAADPLQRLLTAAGHKVRRPLDGTGLLVVDEAVVVGDNLEADPGLNINLTVATDLIDFQRALEMGKIVRAAVQVGRVIVFGGPGITLADILQRTEQRANGQVGINAPALGVYNERLMIQHMGHGVDPNRQAPSLVARQGIPVVLLGKMADLIVCPEATRDPIVPTPRVMSAVHDAFRRMDRGLIAATVQETDLAAHEGDVARIATVLEQVDAGLGLLLPEMGVQDILIISADHGNDPRVNVGRHTREETPLLIYRPGAPVTPLGVRETLADIGATIATLFDAPPTQDGCSIISRRSV